MHSSTDTDPARGGMPTEPPRSPEQRRADAEVLLRSERHLWLATAHDSVPHTVPLAFVYNGVDLLMTTKPTVRSVSNIEAAQSVRVSVGSTRDVLLATGRARLARPSDLDAADAALVSTLPLSPPRVPGCVVIRFTPATIMSWRGMHEMAQRVVMRNGHWLA